MAEVSDRLRKQGYDVAPPDLQAIAWFAEKELWGRKGWTTKTGEGGSFEKKIEDEPGERYLAGVSIQQGELSPSDADMKLTSNRLTSVIAADNAVLAVRVQPTFGLYAGVRERAFDAEWVVQRGQYDPSAAVAELAAVAQENDQWDIFVSRVVAPDEDSPNARPGVEVYLKNPTSLATVMPMLDAFTARGQDGFTLVVDPRAKFGADEFIGVRLQYVPEISMRWDEAERTRLLAPGGIEAELLSKAEALGDIVRDIRLMDGVAFATRQKYDTVVIGKENYDGYIDRGAAGGNRAPGGEAWFGRPLREGLERAVARYEGKRGQVDPGRVPGADAQLQPGLQKSARVTDAPAFKRWFSGSKVVDAEGRPLVVYRGEHGSGDGQPKTLLGSYTFTDDAAVASIYAEEPNDRRTFTGAESPRVIPAYLSIKKPVMDSRDDPFIEFADIIAAVGQDAAIKIARKFSDQIEGTSPWQEGEAGFDSVDQMLKKSPQSLVKQYMQAFPLFDDPESVQMFKDAGFDGAIHLGSGESMDAIEFRVFSPNQIKSAIGNNGEFDPVNQDIRYSARVYPVNPRLESWVNNVRAGRAADPGFVLSESPHPVAQMAGLGRSTPVVITADFVRHLKNKGRDEADVPAGVLAQLQGLLANPRAMIRQSNKGEDSFQFFVDSRNDAGEPLFVVLKRSKLAAGRQEMRVTDVRTAYNHSNSMWYLMKAMEAGEFVWMTEKEIARVRDFTDEGLIPYGAASSAVPPQTTSSVAPGPRKAQVSQATPRTVYGGEALVKFGRGDASWKSATQTVSVSPDDLRRASDQRLAFSARPGAGTWDGPGASRFDDFVYKAQDKLIDTKRVIESITKTGRQIADDLNVYLQEELFHGRAAKRTEDFGTQELGPLMEQLKADGLKIGDIEEYLHARHAKEANALIAGREPSMPDGGSGMTNQAADDYFNNLSPADAAKLDAAAQRVDTILATTRQLYADYGLESQDTVDAWGQMFQNYVPLMREEKEGSGMGIGQGFSVKGKEVKGRTGSTRKVVDILANIAMQRERVIVRGEKNRVAVALVGLASANPSGDFWSVGPPPAERVYDPKTNTVVDRVDPMFKTRDNVLVAKVKDANGDVTEQAVVFNEDDPRALRMAMSLKNLDAGALEGLLGASAKVTRYFSAINTQYNPVFGIVNLIRDVQGALINLGATPLAGQQVKIAGYTASALRGIYGNLRNGGTNQWSGLWQQFQEDGGQTGYRDLFRTSQDRAEALQKTLTPDGWADSKLGKIFTAGGALKVPLVQAKRGAAWIFDWLSDYNDAMENSVRLASYKAALDQGMSREKAASLAKNLTVNFNRKGQVGQQAGALYAFFNAAMQGSAKMGQVLLEMDGGNPKTLRLSPTGKKVVYGGMLLGMTQALALAAAGFDDEDPPEFLRERSLIIPLGGKKYFSIPMPLGLHVIPGLGRHATEFALSGFAKPAKRAVDVFGMFADAFNPIGNAGLSIQTIAPTIIDPLVALKENKDFAGRPIARTTSNPATPGFTQWKDSATAPAKWIAEGINYLSGGSQYVAGVLSPTPDQVDYLFAQVTGGVGRELSKIEQAAKGAIQGEEVASYKIPLFGRFFGDARSQANEGSAFYANSRKLNELETQIKAMRKDGKTAEANALQASRPDAYLITQANVAERQVQRLRREKREMIEGGAERNAVRAKEEQITAAMARLNRAAERQREVVEK